MMVDRRCPTCISLAMFGELKSTTIRSFSAASTCAVIVSQHADMSHTRKDGQAEETEGGLHAPGKKPRSGVQKRGLAMP
eukprot:3379757-Prorocentrum_lima.AAC.1